jgi:hypothetical protein
MGGNAIKKNGKSICGRLSKQNYEQVKNHILSVLKSADIICEIVLELPGKTSFGDIDILYFSFMNKTDMKKFIIEKFNICDPSHIVQNGYVTSCAFDCCNFNHEGYFQLDFIGMQSLEHLEMSRFYFSYGDLGSIIGRIANYYGLKFGDIGLSGEIYESTIDPTKPFDIRFTLGNVLFTNNPKKICEFMGYDYDYWLYEMPKFTSIDDYQLIFNWLTNTKWYNKDIFIYLNNDHRERKLKRPFYQQFCDFIGIKEVKCMNEYIGETGGKDANYQKYAISYFNKNEEVEKILSDMKLKKERQYKFSANDLQNYFKINKISFTGKTVGVELQKFKDYCMKSTLKSDWNNFIDSHQRNEILNIINQYTYPSE